MDRYKIPTTLLLAAMCSGSALANPEEIFDDFIVKANDRVSVQLKVTNGSDTTQDAFLGGPASVQIGTLDNPVTAGLSTAGNYNINIGWDEFFDGGSNPGEGVPSRIRFDISTSNGSPFVSTQDFNSGLRFIQWEIGAHTDPADVPFADPINFRPTLTEITLVQATAVFFRGNTVQNSLAYGFTLNPAWDGTDAIPTNIFTLDATTNRIEITYDYIPIPAPASAATLAGLGFMTARRRRR